MKQPPEKRPQPKHPNTGRPITREEALARMAKENPERIAQLLRDILKRQ